MSTFGLQDRVERLAREVYGSKAWVELRRESYGWRAAVWRRVGGGYLWSVPSDSGDRRVVLARLGESLEAMVRGEARCRYCPRPIPRGYDGSRSCIARPLSPRGTRYECVPGSTTSAQEKAC